MPEVIPYRLRHRLSELSRSKLLLVRNSLRVSAPLLTLIFQKLSPFKSMVAPVVSGSVGGYGTEFLTAEQHERFTFVKTKLCGNKAVDITDLQKNGMHNIVAAMETMMWMEIATFSKVSYLDLVKAFYVYLRTEANRSLTSSVKVVEKMGQAIRSRNLRKSGFSVINDVWTKTSVAEGEAIICEAQEVQEEVGEAAVLLNQEESTTVAVEIQEEIPEALAAAVPDAPIDPESARGESQVVQEKSVEQAAAPAEEQAANFIQEITVQENQMEDAPTQGEQNQENEVVASGHNDIQMEDPPVQEEQIAVVHDDTPMEDAPAEGQILGEKESEPQRERTENPPENQFREGETANSSDSDEQDDHVDQQEPVDKEREKGKEVSSDIPLLTDAPHQRPQRQKIVINLKPVIERLDAQGEILCSVQSDVNSIFMSQASAAKELSQEVRAPAPPAPQPSEGAEEDVSRPSGSVPAEESVGSNGWMDQCD
ncbi:hypothetical protein Taro_020647 [Colocasia esculenta]|uniref:Uncharacterized protein n=1 Tax=Colocasia esculenta TaxID=4460 RepID=A0A843V080_COLES|nr:hypothetical protein [Colocasia esculenta]